MTHPSYLKFLRSLELDIVLFSNCIELGVREMEILSRWQVYRLKSKAAQ